MNETTIRIAIRYAEHAAVCEVAGHTTRADEFARESDRALLAIENEDERAAAQIIVSRAYDVVEARERAANPRPWDGAHS